MWTCPRCGREFKNKNQVHSCKLIDKEQLFAKRPPQLKTIYKNIVSFVQTLGEFKEETVPPDVIFFKSISTFLGVKIKATHLEVEFFLDHHENNPVISKYLQTSAYRFAHVVPVVDLDEVDIQLKTWIKHSYQLVLAKKAK